MNLGEIKELIDSVPEELAEAVLMKVNAFKPVSENEEEDKKQFQETNLY